MEHSSTYQVDSTTSLHVVSAGNPDSTKPTLIFLHFWGGSSGTYKDVISYLSLGFHCIAVDFRGWGSSTGPKTAESYSIHQLATDIETLIPKLNVQDFILIGHSMGGKVAQLMAGRNLVNGLKGAVLIAPAPPTPFELPRDMQEQQLTAYSSAESAGFVVENVLSASKLPEEMVSSLVEDMLKGNEFAKKAWPAYAMGEEIVGQATEIKVPVLVIGGGRDIVEPVGRLEKEVLGRIQAAELVVVEESGHLLPVEAPAAVARHIVNFMTRVAEQK